jgi:hypothetical protein
MKAILLTIAGLAALVSLPAEAGHRHHVHVYPRVTVGYGYPYHYGYPYGHFYRSSYYGFGFGLWPRYRTRRVRTEPAEVRTRKLYVYPAAGQSDEQLADDRYECHVWAADSTGFDPTLGAGSADEAADYGRAFSACMEGRDYVVK